jgi:hypothetical protein
VLQPEQGAKLVLYGAFMANGECWPPVIFTSEKTESRGNRNVRYVEGKDCFAFVHYMPDGSAPSRKLTAIWLEDMNSSDAAMVEGRHHLVLDKATWHTSAKIVQLFDSYDITPHFIPAGTGKWLNPLDQSIHREIRRRFITLQQVRRSNRIDNLIRAYYSVSKAVVDGSWRHTALLEGDISAHLTKVATEGYHAPSGQEQRFSLYTDKFNVWANSDLSARRLAAVQPYEIHANKRRLDGAYWSSNGSSNKRNKGKRE